MARLFGTDGIRGVANVDLKPTLAYALGRAVAHRLVGPGGSLVVGQDTRRSGDMFVAAIAAGATSMGVDTHIVGVVPTPALAFMAGQGPFAAGIMVSASHNPALDNGLKVLDADGLHLVLDAANGSGSAVGRAILEATGARVDVIHAAPDGININVDSGATAPASLAAAVVAAGADAGFALDGDADRLIAVDANGRVVDGDQVLGILALDRLSRDDLPGGGLVVSVLSNGGLQGVVEAAGGQVVRTPVGDKYILEGMQVSGAVLGGEKSGHVIILEHTTSGDGIVTALEVLRVMAIRSATLADLAAEIPMLPQQQRAVTARHKDQWEGDAALQRAISAASARLGASGRVLVRPSGTEPALRVMVEGPDEALVTELADSLAALAGERLN